MVATGGGPGAMEAANLGGPARARPEAALDEALDRLAARAVVPTRRSMRGSTPPGRSRRVSGDADSLGIPTWFYGHEPTNVFATAIAKYFRNALREAILLQICDAGIVFLPGAAGTVQEVFQDACENYYAAESSVAPMVLVGGSYWTEHRAGLAAAAVPGRRARRWSSTCTWSTPSTRPPPWSAADTGPFRAPYSAPIAPE